MNFQPILYAVTGGVRPDGLGIYEQVELALQGGVTCVQFRGKMQDDDAFLQDARRLAALCHRYHVPLLLNDRVHLVHAAGADGVHVGQQDLSAREARAILGPDKILGVSARTPELALQAERDGADYLGTGAVFPTGSKADAREIGPEGLRAVCSAVRIPVVAIGGISAENIHRLTGCGMQGVAVISAVFGQPDIAQAARILRAKVGEAMA